MKTKNKPKKNNNQTEHPKTQEQPPYTEKSTVAQTEISICHLC
jgi:hypothetical protein